MTVTTRTHGRCAVNDCTNPGRVDVIQAHPGRWHLIDGFVYSAERRTFVGDSWGQACDEHRVTVAQAVQADIEGWRDRWSVRVQTLDYGDPDAGSTNEYAHGVGRDETHLF